MICITKQGKLFLPQADLIILNKIGLLTSVTIAAVVTPITNMSMAVFVLTYKSGWQKQAQALFYDFYDRELLFRLAYFTRTLIV